MLPLLAACIVLFGVVGETVDQPTKPQRCTDCHDARPAEGHSITEALSTSVHARVDCTDCHASIELGKIDASSPKPHGAKIAAVDCGTCHEAEMELYQVHGRLKVGSDPDIPKCWSCHGTHDVLPSSDRSSRVNPINLPQTCATCHTNTDVMKNHQILRDEPIKLFAASVHGRAAERGLEMAANCSDCHSSDGPNGRRTAHRILSAASPESTIHHFNIPDTCGKCHKGIAADYWEGIHGQLVKRGEIDAPVCTRCHGEHGILPASDVRSPVSAARLAEATCAPCHESAILNERYGIPAGRLKSYVDSYHGLKRKAGNVHVANCSSCHGDHRILPHTDPRSSIHPSNLKNTCGECHPGISAVLANAPIHESATGLHTGWARFFATFYMWLIGGTIGLMVLHNLGHWVRHLRSRSLGKYVVRMSPGETAQHWVLMISFTILVISGFSLRFSDAWWVDILFGWGGGEGFVIRGMIHRIAAIIFVFWAIWHLIYLFSRRGQSWIKDMIANRRDAGHILHNAMFFIGRENAPPRFGRFTYMEKCEYWALIWGTVIMTVTGILLWFDNYFVQEWRLPKGLLDVALVIHYYEAWLAFLAILVWHIYGTVFSPTAYPMNPAWWAGRMPVDMYHHEHAEGPALKVHIPSEESEIAPVDAPVEDVIPPHRSPSMPEMRPAVTPPGAKSSESLASSDSSDGKGERGHSRDSVSV